MQAQADQITADVPAQTVDFIGKDVRLAKDGGTIRGTQMRTDGR